MSITGDSYRPTKAKAAVDGLLVTGDCTKNNVEKVDGVMFVNFPTALHYNLEHGNNPVNRHSESGKKLGAAVIGYTQENGVISAAELLFAAGKKEQSQWFNAKSLVGADTAHITPNKVEVNTSIIGDQPAIHDTIYEGSTFMSLYSIKVEELKSSVSMLNQPSLSGKKAGALVLAVTHDDSEHAVYAAAGSDPKDPWIRLAYIKSNSAGALAATLTPADDPFPHQSVIGDCKRVERNKEGVILHALPEFPKEGGFLDSASVVNITFKSGKRLGSMCVIHDGTTSTGLYMANGDTPKSHWVCLVSLKGTATDLVPTP